MAENEPADASSWLSVIAKSLAHLCLSRVIEREPKKYEDVLAKVKFLQGLGLSQDDAAGAAESTPGSVRVLVHLRDKVKNGKAKKKRTKKSR